MYIYLKVMSISDMRALRILNAHRYLRNLINQRLPSDPTVLSCKPYQNPKIYCHFHYITHSTSPPLGLGNRLASNHCKSSASRPNDIDISSRNVRNLCVYGFNPTSGFATQAQSETDDQGPDSSGEDENPPISPSLHQKDVPSGRSSWSKYSVGRSEGAFVGFRKNKKSKTSYVCSNCGQTYGQWWGSCRECNRSGTISAFVVEDESDLGKTSGFQVSENVLSSWLAQQSAESVPLRLTDVNRGINQLDWRIPLSGLFGTEVARVLGGGLVPGSLVLVGGDPGVGKSTLLLQIAAIIAEGLDFGKPAPVVYVSGEESVEQIGNRADRMRIGTDELFLYSSTDIEDILRKIQSLSPRALIVDSIQTVYLRGVTGSAGGLSQVKECTSALLRFAKKTNIPVLLIGHVTKSGDIAGPRVLEHIVDVVLYMEGEKHSSHRLLRSVKNRFGSTDELGVFEMSQSGLQAVSNASEMFLSEQLSDSEFLAGLAVAVIMDGSRSFLIEIQALCDSSSSVSRQVNGVQGSRADMIISVLKKQAGLKLQDNGIFLNVVSGVTLTEPAGDLAIAAAICSRVGAIDLSAFSLDNLSAERTTEQFSCQVLLTITMVKSFLGFSIPNNIAFIGEIGLGGELRTVPRMEKRVNTVAKLGYKQCIVPKSAEKHLADLGIKGTTIVGCRNLKEMINAVFI